MRISDWSSDVCSSDLNLLRPAGWQGPSSTCDNADPVDRTWNADPCDQCRAYSGGSAATSCCCPGAKPDSLLSALRDGTSERSEERSVGNEWVHPCKYWGWPDHKKNNTTNEQGR